MAYNVVKVFVFVILTTNLPQTESAKVLTASEQASVEKGMEAGRNMADFLANNDFGKSIQNFGKKLGPFLGALGPIAAIILSFTSSGESPELVFMREQFEEVNNKLEVITAEFAEVRDAIDWNTVLVSFGSYERKIRSGASNLDGIYKLEGMAAREVMTKDFVWDYQNYFDNSLDNLYEAVMFNKNVLSTNIFDAEC